jgi:hypothetical protein
VAVWPAGTITAGGTDLDGSSDEHDTFDQAEAVCDMLNRDGFGGEGKIFPLRTYVEPVKGTACPDGQRITMQPGPDSFGKPATMCGFTAEQVMEMKAELDRLRERCAVTVSAAEHHQQVAELEERMRHLVAVSKRYDAALANLVGATDRAELLGIRQTLDVLVPHGPERDTMFAAIELLLEFRPEQPTTEPIPNHDDAPTH